MSGFFNALSASLVLLMLMSVGYFMGIKGWMTAQEKKFVSKYIVNIAVPCNCVVGLMNNLSHDQLAQAGVMLVSALLGVGATLLLSIALGTLLKLPRDVLEALRANGLTERHGRALLRLPDANAQREALIYIVENGLTVAATDEYIEALLTQPEEEASPDRPEPRRTLVLKDVRIFLNSLSRSLEVMKQGGIAAGMRREETEDSLILTISIPKAKTPV